MKKNKKFGKSQLISSFGSFSLPLKFYDHQLLLLRVMIVKYLKSEKVSLTKKRG